MTHGIGTGSRTHRATGWGHSIGLLAILAILLSGLAIATPWTTLPPAAAAALAPCDGNSTQGGLTITASHGKVFYVDTGVTPKLDAAYAAYRLTNSSGSTKTNLWIAAQNFSGGMVTLAHPSDQYQQVPTLANSSTSASFFLLKAVGATSTAQSHIVRVYDRNPALAGANVVYSCSFTFTKVAETIQASSNKVASVALSNSTPQLGQTTAITVLGQGGTIGSGQAPDGSIVWVTPAAYANWPTRALRLESTTLTFGKVNANASPPTFSTSGCGGLSYTNQLIVSNAKTVIGNSCSDYQAVYTFRAIGPTLAPVTISPVAQIASGARIKHTNIGGSSSGTIDLSGITSPLSAVKTVTATSSLDETTINGTAYLEVPYRITVSSTSATQSNIDELIDEPAVGASIVPGSVRITDVDDAGTVGADPTFLLAEAALSPRPYHFTGPFQVSSAASAQITYRMYVPKVAGTYTNTVVAKSGDTVIGAGASFEQRTTVTTDGTTSVASVDDTVPLDPTVSTEAATSVGLTSATLHGIVDGNDTSPATSFEYATNAAFTGSATATATPSPVTGTSATAISATLSGLASGTTYYYRAKAGSQTGSTLTFNTTEVVATPTAVTEPASGIIKSGSTYTVTLNGVVDANQTATSIYFRYSSTSSTLTSGTTEIPVVDPDTNAVVTTSSAYPSSFSQDVSSLAAGLWYFAIVGKYSGGEVVGNILSFRTGTAQTITFATPDDTIVTSPDFTVSPTASSSLPVTVTSETTSVCTVSGHTVHLVAAGTCTLTGTQNGDATYASADPQTVSFLVVDALAITTGSPLTSGSQSVAYPGVTFAASGGSGSYASWSVTAGSLPTGLTLDASAGILYGTPTTIADSTFTLQVTDSLGFTATKEFTVSVVGAPTISTTSPLAAGSVDVTYSGVTFAATGGSGSYSTWALSAGSLPAGLSLASATGVLSGTPTSAGTSTFTVRVTDSLGGTATKDFSLTVYAAPTITTTSPLAGGTADNAYSDVTFAASGGSGVYSSWAVASGSLPTGLSLASGTGVLSGTPTVAGTYSFDIRVTDSLGGTATKSFTLTVIGPLAISTASLPDGEINVAYSTTVAAGGGTSPYSNWRISAGSLPSGLSIASGTGVISGTPGASGDFSITVAVDDAVSATATKTFTLTIAPAPDATTLDDSTITSVSATFHGRINPKGGSNTNITFQYSTDSGLGSGVTTVEGRSGLNGNSDVDDSVTVSGLDPYTTYYYRIRATNARGTANGSIKSLRTDATSPLATTDDTDAVSSTSAVLNGTVNARGPSADVVFEYSTDSGLASGVSTVTHAGKAVGNASTDDSVTLTGLDPYTTYYYRVKATTGAHGNNTGSIKSFRTGASSPLATTLDDSAVIDDTTIRIKGQVRARGAATSVEFEYSKSASDLSSIDDTVSGTAVAPDDDDTKTVTVTDLRPGTTYYFRVKGSNVHGNAQGVIRQVRIPPGRPKATTMSAVTVTATTAVIRGSVNAWGGSDGKAKFKWSPTSFVSGSAAPARLTRRLTPRADSTTPEVTVTGTDDSTTTYSLTGLTPSTTYYYEVTIDTSRDGTADSADGGVLSFTTDAAYSVTYSGNGSDGGSVPTDASSPYASGSTVTVLGNTGSLTKAGFTFSGWNTESNGTGTPYSAGATFTITANKTLHAQWTAGAASAPTVTTDAATGIGSTSATLNATVNANGSDTTALTIKYSASQATVDAGNGTTATITPTSATGSGNTSVSANVTGLSPSTAYYFRVSATNAGGTSDGATRSFTTSAAGGGGPGSPTQVITFPSPADLYVDEGPITLTATASSGLAVRYTSSTHEVCTIDGTRAVIVAAGLCTITAHQDGDTTWQAATPVKRSVTVSKRPQVINLPRIDTLPLTTLRFPIEPANHDATPRRATRAGLPGLLVGTTIDLTSLTPATCRVTDGIVTLRSVGRCTLRATSDGSPVYLPAERELSFTIVEADLLRVVEPGPIEVPVPPLPPNWTVQVPTDAPHLQGATITAGSLIISPAPGFTGVLDVPVEFLREGRDPISGTLHITVVPRRAGAGTYTPTAAHRTTLTWQASPTRSVVAYEVRVDGRRVCTTTLTTCEATRLIGPRPAVTVVAIGDAGTRSAPRTLRYLPAEPVLVTVIHFDSDQDALTRAAKKKLTKLAAIIREQAFRKLLVEGHTDSISSEKYNRALSQRRINSAVEFLKKKLQGLRISEKALGELFPADTNATAQGRANNRRVEISVW